LGESKIAVEQQDLDLQRNVYTAFTDKALNAHESSIVALESDRKLIIMRKKNLMLA
jgi:outer membrane protein